MFHKGITYGKHVDAHIIVSEYWLPDFIRGKGPTESLITRVGNVFLVFFYTGAKSILLKR